SAAVGSPALLSLVISRTCSTRSRRSGPWCRTRVCPSSVDTRRTSARSSGLMGSWVTDRTLCQRGRAGSAVPVALRQELPDPPGGRRRHLAPDAALLHDDDHGIPGVVDRAVRGVPRGGLAAER